MSYELAEVAGLRLPGMGPGLCSRVHIGTFAGGQHGSCIQITIGDQFVQLNVPGVAEVHEALGDWLRAERQEEAESLG